jgi:predicted DCC family thiol-disulfide oxidoreductase YuxK
MEWVLGACYASTIVSPLAPEPEMLFYDGHCALCHRSVKFVLKHDRSGKLFRFAPLQGPTFEARVAAEKRVGLPDSVVVLTNEGALLTRSNVFLHVLRRLGGGWQALAAVIGVIPRLLRDLAYDFIARVRYRVFGKREDWCPVIAPELRARFDP